MGTHAHTRTQNKQSGPTRGQTLITTRGRILADIIRLISCMRPSAKARGSRGRLAVGLKQTPWTNKIPGEALTRWPTLAHHFGCAPHLNPLALVRARRGRVIVAINQISSASNERRANFSPRPHIGQPCAIDFVQLNPAAKAHARQGRRAAELNWQSLATNEVDANIRGRPSIGRA